MRILVYKRTHNGDPDSNGCFGVYDCMGSVRNLEYDAVIGVGGIGPEAQYNRISGKINWVGIGPHKRTVHGKRGPEVTFDSFFFYGEKGVDFSTSAPILAQRMYSNNVRFTIIGPNDKEYSEVNKIIISAPKISQHNIHEFEPKKKCQ